jgi:hypothetical protein
MSDLRDVLLSVANHLQKHAGANAFDIAVLQLAGLKLNRRR